MSDGDDAVTRRRFIRGATAAVVATPLINSAVLAGQGKEPRSLDDPAVTGGKIGFKSRSESIDGYLSRPTAAGRFPAVIVVAGNTISEEYIPNTTALLAEAGFVGLAPNIYSLQTESMTPEQKRLTFTTRITDEHIFQDIEASLAYLKQQPFVRPGPSGIMGFCFGGRIALMFAVRSREIGAVAPFYGNLVAPPEANRATNPMDMLRQLKVPVQGHYARNDSGIPPDQLKTFEESLRAQGTPVEIFSYEAQHGFFAYTRPSYNAEAARLSWSRTVAFFSRNLKSN